MNIEQPDFFKALDAALSSIPLEDWKTYLRWHLIHSVAPALSAKFVGENFNFYGQNADRRQRNASAMAAMRGIDGRRAG